MLETNIKIVEPGVELQLTVRCAEVIGHEITADLMQKACNHLSVRHGLAAVISLDKKKLFVATENIVPAFELKGDDWHLEVRDAGYNQTLKFRNQPEQPLLAQLIERAFVARLIKRRHLWDYDSLRIWYEPTAFQTSDGVAVYNRYEVSAIAIQNVGVGICIDVGTKFFSAKTVADYFVKGVSALEKTRLQTEFERFTLRQKDRKGTLKYDFGKNKHKCYFDSFMPGTTAGTPGTMRIEGVTYTSLQDYYKRKHRVEVDADEPIAKVSFPNIDRAQPVVARFLTLSVGNEALPRSLKQIDKIAPQQRFDLLKKFWRALGDEPLGRKMPKVAKHFYRPPRSSYFKATPPALLFADGRRLEAPRDNSLNELKAYYRERLQLLNEVGCLDVPPAIQRTIYVAVPDYVSEAAAIKLADDIAARLSQWTRKDIAAEPIFYKTVDDAIAQLKNQDDAGLVLFVFNQENPTTYFHLSYELKGWRVKRITAGNLIKQTREMLFSADGEATEIPKGWTSFVEMNALDLVQLMNCIPWGFADELEYEAQLVIDVGADRRYFALSLLINRPHSSEPLRLETVVHAKCDFKKETINETILCDEIVKLCQRVGIDRFDFKPLNSLLFVRDGRDCGRELQAIETAQTKLKELGFFAQNAKLHTIDAFKTSVKGIRLWDRAKSGEIRLCAEGSGLLLDSRTVVLVNTGAATLRQGTAEPVMLVARGSAINIGEIANYFHAACQLNWSSPKVAQRISIALKRTDDELKNRAAQEMRRAS